MSLYSKILTKHRFACLTVDRATSLFGPFDVLNRESSQSSLLFMAVEVVYEECIVTVF